MDKVKFDDQFKALTGNCPFPWQRALYERFALDDIPGSCNLPTGLGKTSVIAVWLIALAAHPDKMPRRLVYVVNRRTVVDQTTEEVEKYRGNLREAGLWDCLAGLSSVPLVDDEFPLAVSTLRGQFADNREWSADPSRPAVISGTVDMIGSRLLFSGYGVGLKARPLHAGFLGQDALVVHDEAHLEPAFQDLVKAVEAEQERSKEFRRFRVMELTATTRGDVGAFPDPEEKRANEANAEVRRRITARKSLYLHKLEDAKKLAEQVADLALKFRDSNRAVLVYVRTVEDVVKVRDRLKKDRRSVEILTGTLRGKERDELVMKGSLARFLSKAAEGDETVYLVCTSAGEVGVNISADHLVCDLSTFESMAQRFGRVNRFGLCDDTEIHIVFPEEFEKGEYDKRRSRTLELLRRLPRDASPRALGELPADERQAAFAPPPTILPVTDILFDAWALTTIRGDLPGRPKVEPYLHGLAEWQPPETRVAWRMEVERLQPRYDSDQERDERQAEDRRALARLASELLEDYPLKPHELLREPTDRALKQFDAIARRCPDLPVWLLDDDGKVQVLTLAELADKDEKERVNGVTVLLPPSAGGLEDGMLNGSAPAPAPESGCLDVADEWYADKEKTVRRRMRSDENKPDGMRLIRRVPLPGGGEESEPDYWYWFEVGNEGGSTAKKPVEWDVHVKDVEGRAGEIVQKLLPDDGLQNAIRLAAKFHDHGKRRKVFQTNLGNASYPSVRLAKSGKTGGRVTELYRHEFGSLIDVRDEPEFQNLNDDEKDLVLHLIAAHHGRARPHFSADEAFDPEHTAALAEEIARAVPRRFARLQRKYGRWGLAYLESLLRAADWAASAQPSEYYVEDER